jgi:hypothetical protein
MGVVCWYSGAPNSLPRLDYLEAGKVLVFVFSQVFVHPLNIRFIQIRWFFIKKLKRMLATPHSYQLSFNSFIMQLLKH